MALPVLLVSSVSAGVQYLVEFHGYDFSRFEAYHNAHMTISILMLAFAIAEGHTIWRRELGNLEKVREASQTLAMISSSHCKDKEAASARLERIQDCLLAAVYVAFAIVDPALEKEAAEKLPLLLPSGLWNAISKVEIPTVNHISVTTISATSTLGEVPGGADETKPARSSQVQPDYHSEYPYLCRSIVGLLLERIATYKLEDDEIGAWLAAGSFHYAFDAQLFSLHSGLLAMVHDAESGNGAFFAYVHLLTWNITCLLIFTPFGLTADGWLNPLFTATIVFTYGGLLLIVRWLSSPFTCEPRDRSISLSAVAIRLDSEWKLHRALVAGSRQTEAEQSTSKTRTCIAVKASLISSVDDGSVKQLQVGLFNG
eukprot:CAMPEP_0115827484 /NCGR_PEP_ID=MMETSP0287-20121206/69_1 /TAXON_ID=412157 /ORGANISM="Chrysochromulina rotalis, Strain UIO044" /LENGTH=370 /DNA_ID=CAMNT_0003280645 /DNA_START=88 /DNA_END=1200 /DNA_ORIENTATION=+